MRKIFAEYRIYIVFVAFQFILTNTVFSQFSGPYCDVPIGQEVTYTYNTGYLNTGSSYATIDHWELASYSGQITYDDHFGTVKVRWSTSIGLLHVYLTLWSIGYDGEGNPVQEIIGYSEDNLLIGTTPTSLNNTVHSTGNTTYYLNQIPASLAGDALTNSPCAVSVALEWYMSTSPSGPFNLVGTGEYYSFSSPLTQTSYFKRKLRMANGTETFSNIVELTVIPLWAPDPECIDYLGKEITYTADVGESGDSYSINWSIVGGEGEIVYNDNDRTVKVIWWTLPAQLVANITYIHNTGNTDEYGFPIYELSYGTSVFNANPNGTTLPNVIKTVNGNTSFSYNQVPESLIETVATTGQNTCMPTKYQWLSSSSALGPFNTISGAEAAQYNFTTPLQQTTYFRRAIISPDGATTYSNIIKLNVVSANWENLTYTREHTVLVPGITDWKAVDQLPIGQKLQTTFYFDGMGRPTEKVSREMATPGAGSTLWGDVVEVFEYDPYSRQTKGYLPYTTIAESGKFKSAPITNQSQYYNSIYNESNAYVAPTYDNSPLNRVINKKSPGSSWANSQGNAASYDLNDASDNVQILSIGFASGDIPVRVGVYADNTLFKTVKTDENNKQVIEYTNKNGQLILKKIQFDDNVGGGHTGWICTYQVYDDFGRLRYQLQPEAVKWLEANGWDFTAPGASQMIDGLCFRYEYDEKGRNVLKKAPGAKELYMLFDKRDRLVFTQDGNQRINSTGEWSVNFYDEFDRATLTGLYKTAKTVSDLKTDATNSINYSSGTTTIPNVPANYLVVPTRNLAIPLYKAGISIEFSTGFESGTNDVFTAEIDPQMIVYTTTGGNLVSEPVPAADVNDPSKFTALKYNYYDNYNYVGVKAFDNNFNNTQAYAPATTVDPIVKTARTNNMVTGTKVRVLETSTFLLSSFYYDEKGRSIQTLGENIKTGTDITTTQYHFDGRLLSSETRHSASGTVYSNYSILTKYTHDLIGRMASIQKKYGTNGFKTIVSYDLDDMGRLKTKHLDPGYTGSGKSEMESLTYTYNIHDQITGINKDYALKTPGIYNKWGNFFGLFLGYDKQQGIFTNARLDDLVTGAVWTTQGDDAQRKYDYSYDNAGRLTKAVFNEYTPPSGGTAGGWNNAKMDFSVTGLNGKIEYDLNGNLLYMIQKGVVPGNPTPVNMDDLRYSYGALSNKLTKVVDGSPLAQMGINGKFGDFSDGGNGVNDDYVFDDNGNLIKDLNKDVKDLVGTNGIKYNYLDKPEEIKIVGKGTIKLVYDAVGNKLQKIFTPDGSSTSTVTSYINSFVYRGDDLQYINFEEGRVRVMQTVSQNNSYGDFLNINGNMDLPGSKRGAYDFFIRDYQGNVRMIVTEETHTGRNVCTMETLNGRYANEEPVFGQVDANGTPTVNNEVKARFAVGSIPGQSSGNGWQNSAIGSYVSQLGNLARKVGPNAFLKVMAGDEVSAEAIYYYQNNVTNQAGGPSLVSDLLVSLVQAISGSPITSGVAKTAATNITNQLSTSVPFGTMVDPDANNATGNNPKAYLGILYFDERFNLIEDGSETKRVTQSGSGALPLVLPYRKAPKNGYALVYLCNESDEMVYFDNLQVTHNRGRIIEEDHYYAYGLKIPGISSRKLADAGEGDMDNKYLYNDKELIDEADLDWYDYGFRSYDAQIGRFTQLDPLTFEYPFLTPYQYASCEPVGNIDVDGLEGGGTLAPVYVYGKIGGTTFAPSIVQGVKSFVGNTVAFAVMVLNAWGSDNLGGWGLGDPERFGNFSPAAKLGQNVGHFLGLATSSLEIATGITGQAGGLLLDAGGVTAPVGAGVHVVSGLAMTHGLLTWTTAWNNLFSSDESTGSSSNESGSSSSGSRSVEERTIGESKWSSKEVSEASKSIDAGKTDITVPTKADAEELFARKFANRGYKNTTDMTPKQVKADEWRLGNSKDGTYHWDAADHNHPLPHLQVHETAAEGGEIIRISYKN